MKKLLTKVLSCSLAAVVTVSALSACGNGSGNPSGSGTDGKTDDGSKKTLSVSVFAQEHEQAIYKEVLKKFEEENNVKVDLKVSGDQYWPELESALTSNSAPDVFFLGVSDVRKRVWTDKVIPLDDLINTEDLSDVWPEALNLYKYDSETDVIGEGKLYALPKDFSAVSMAVNKAIIEKRRPEIEALVKDGTLPFFPEADEKGNLPVYTFTEFATLCKTLTFEDPTLPETAGSTQVYGTHLWEDFTLQPFIWGAGGDYLNEDHTKVLFDSPEFIEGYEGFMKIVEMGGSGLSTDETTGYLKFLAGRTAYFPCGTWDVGAFQAIETDEAVNPGKEWFDFDLAPWPISDKYADLSIEERQDKWFGRIDSVGFAISTQCKEKELAAKLVAMFSADEEVQRFLSEKGSQLPNLMSIAKEEYLKDDKYYPETRQVFINMLSGQNGKRIPTTYTFDGMWHTDAFISGVDSVWSYYEGTDKGVPPMSVKDYVTSIQANAQEMLDQSVQSANDLNPNG